MAQADRAATETPRYPLYEPKVHTPKADGYDENEPLYTEAFCACGGLLRVRARAYQMPGLIQTFEERHPAGEGRHRRITRVEFPEARAAEEKRAVLQQALNEAIADGADSDEITTRVAKAERRFKPRALPHFDPTATPED